jgi:hypothetical protein
MARRGASASRDHQRKKSKDESEARLHGGPKADDCRGCFRVYFRRDWDETARQKMTLNVASPPTITAVQKGYSITSSAGSSIHAGWHGSV